MKERPRKISWAALHVICKVRRFWTKPLLLRNYEESSGIMGRIANGTIAPINVGLGVRAKSVKR